MPNKGVYNSRNLQTYHYANNNPIKYTDPTGRIAWIPIIAGIIWGINLGGLGGAMYATFKNENLAPGEKPLDAQDWAFRGMAVGGVMGGVLPLAPTGVVLYWRGIVVMNAMEVKAVAAFISGVPALQKMSQHFRSTKEMAEFLIWVSLLVQSKVEGYQQRLINEQQVNQAREEGRQEGIAIGEARAREDIKQKLINNYIKVGYSPEEAARKAEGDLADVDEDTSRAVAQGQTTP